MTCRLMWLPSSMICLPADFGDDPPEKLFIRLVAAVMRMRFSCRLLSYSHPTISALRIPPPHPQ
jgi:hypothetical protein